MTRKTAVVQGEREMVRQCHRGLSVPELQTQLMRTLRHLMPVDAAFFATADPQTLLFTGAFAEDPLAAESPLLLANEFGGRDVNKFSALATSTTHVATLDNATRHDRAVSERSREIMTPLGLGDELRAALVADGQCWGYLCLHRGNSTLGFTSAEVAMMARFVPHIASGLRQAQLLHPRPSDRHVARPGVVLLGMDLTVVAISAEAEELLSLIDGDHATAQLPLPVYTVAAALSTIQSEASVPQQLPTTKVHTSSGDWVQLHASRLQGAVGDEQIAVVVELLDARSTAPLMLAAYRLTARETQVAQLVLRGASTRVIVDTLHISQHTVQDHLKAVFDKTGVTSRRDLVAHLTSQAGAERAGRGSR